MELHITPVSKGEYQSIVDLWEASVRATHDFLPESDIVYFKPLILNEYLDAVDLRCARDDSNQIIGFLGTAENKIEMLFIHPDSFGSGVGKLLLKYGIKELGATKVDVNEDNPNAVGFYNHMGFEVVSRSELDPLGKPYPILSMELR
ncbi:MAG: GNAT family N-acetyltransferase [Cyclobacteriaceae bacterium]